MSVVELDEENSGSLSDSRAPCNSRYANNFRDRLPKVASFDSRSILASVWKKGVDSSERRIDSRENVLASENRRRKGAIPFKTNVYQRWITAWKDKGVLEFGRSGRSNGYLFFPLDSV